VVLFGSRPRGEAPQQMLFAVEQIPQRPARSAAGLKDRAGAAWDWACRAAPADCRSFPSQKRPRVAREAEMDQAQVIEIPGIEAWDTGDYRTT
jgi:hypothetical protein